MVPRWLRRRQDARRLAQADAEALIGDHGAEAYSEARQRERDEVLPDATTHAGRTDGHPRCAVALMVGDDEVGSAVSPLSSGYTADDARALPSIRALPTSSSPISADDRQASKRVRTLDTQFRVQFVDGNANVIHS